jgi:DnaJ-class molecular chaperone
MTKEEAMKILDVGKDMAENIKKNYLRLSRENHPDAGGDPNLFKKIHEAYLVLTEVSPESPNRQETLSLNVEVSLEEAIFGVVLETHIRPNLISSRPMIGENKSYANAQVITVVENIPALMLLQFGSITFSHKDQMINGSIRNINITYSIRIHERYKPYSDKKKALLEVEEIIPVTTALYGGIVEVKTLYGIRKLFIKPGTNIGDIYEIKNHGHLGSLMVIISSMSMPLIHDMDQSCKSMEEKAMLEIEKEEKEIENNFKSSGVKSSS